MTAGWAEPGDTSAGIQTEYLERVTDDIQLILGAGIEIDAVEIVDIDRDDAPPVRSSPERDDADPRGGERRTGLRARYHLGERSFETTAPGDSLIDAHRQLRARLVVDRLRLTFSETVEPGGGAKRAANPPAAAG